MIDASSHFRRRLLGATAVVAAAVMAASTAAAQAYQLPLRGESLASDERFNTAVHSGKGAQTEAKDIEVVRRQSDGTWTKMRAGASDPAELTSWLAYGKPVHAMAAGTVVGCWRNAPENVPGSYSPFYTNLKYDGNGNHLWVLQDDGFYALYAHMQPGSVPSALCPHDAPLFTGFKQPDTDWTKAPNIAGEAAVANGARVTAGQLIGLIGNSGASGQRPHLHVHVQMAGGPVVMPFATGMTTPWTDKAAMSGPWTKLAGAPMPNATILFWPPNTPGNYRVTVPAAEYQSQADHLAESGLMPQTITCSGDGAAYDTTWVPKTATWASLVGMSVVEAALKNATLTSQGFTRTWAYTCGSKTASIWRK